METTLELIIPAEAKQAAAELSVPENRALELFKPFAEPFEAALELLGQEAAATTAKDARALRLKMVKARTAIKDVKDSEKEEAKRTARIVDFYHNKSTAKLSEAEARLRAIEEAEERAEEARRKALSETRSAELTALGADAQFYPLGTMPEEGYKQLLTAIKAAAEAKKAAELKTAEDARIASEKAEAERIERERIAAEEAARKEAERLAALAEANRLAAEARAAAEAAAAELARVEAAAKAERDAAAAEAKRLADEARAEQLKRDAEIIAQRAAEKAERDRLQAIADAAAAEERRLAKVEADRLAEEARLARVEAARLAKIEADRVAAEQEAKRQAEIAAKKAAQAPDKEKLVALADAVVATAMPTVSTPEAQAIVEEFQSMLQRARAWIIKKTEAM